VRRVKPEEKQRGVLRNTRKGKKKTERKRDFKRLEGITRQKTCKCARE